MKLVARLTITVSVLAGTSGLAFAAAPGNTESAQQKAVSAPARAEAHATNHKTLLKQIYADDYVGYRIPREEETAINRTGGHTTYGEITYDSTQSLLKELSLTPDDVFIDLGSGVGKMVLQVSLESPVKESIGVEFSKSRCDQANNARDQLIKAGYKKPNQKVEFWNTDMLKADIGRATVVFLNGVAHQEQFNRRVIDKLSEAPHPIRVISVVPLTQHPRMKEIKRLSLPMSWDEKGVETVIYETVPASHKVAS